MNQKDRVTTASGLVNMWKCKEGIPGDSMKAPYPFPHPYLALYISYIWLYLSSILL